MEPQNLYFLVWNLSLSTFRDLSMLLHISIVIYHSFLVLLFHCVCIHTRFFNSFTCDRFGYFQYLVITNKAAIIICVQVVWTYVFSFLGKISKIEWLSSMAGTCLTFKETVRLFSKVVIPFYSLTRVLVAPYPYQHLV